MADPLNTDGVFTCLHIEARAESTVYVIRDPRDQAKLIYAFHARVKCGACGAAFRFLGDNKMGPTDPLDALETKLGAWASNAGDEIACMVAPFESGEALALAPAAGRA